MAWAQFGKVDVKPAKKNAYARHKKVVGSGIIGVSRTQTDAPQKFLNSIERMKPVWAENMKIITFKYPISKKNHSTNFVVLPPFKICFWLRV